MMKQLIMSMILAISGITLIQGQDKTFAYESVENDPTQTRIYTLENGLKVYLSHNDAEPRLNTMIAVRAGSKFDPAETTGLAHYLEHMVFKGTSEIGSKDWEKEKVELAKIKQLYEDHRMTNDPEAKKKIYHAIDSVSQVAAQYVIPNEYDKMITSLGAKGTNAFTMTDQTVYVNDIPSNELEKWLFVESERFSELVLRLFHTELEAVYEEFNRGQDVDTRRAIEAVYKSLFQKHPYGTQTTIGKGEHLKNPSMVKIHEYFDTYYVPNNMAVVISGDLDYDKTIALIDKYFGQLKPGEVPEFTYEPEDPMTQHVTTDVFGPQAESVWIAYRTSGMQTKDYQYYTLIADALTNGKAGMIDLNLVQQQKVLQAGAGFFSMVDYGMLYFYGRPRQGQPLEEVAELMLNEVEKLKQGEFEDWMIEAIINNQRLKKLYANESNGARTSTMKDAFIDGLKWEDVVKEEQFLANITKEDLVQFASKNLKENYAIIYKRQGIDSSVVKMEKPHITPLDITRDEKSAFYNSFEKLASDRVTPIFIDFQSAIQHDQLADQTPIQYIKNVTNAIFDQTYVIELGTDHNPWLGLADSYLPYLGTTTMSREEINKRLYRLGLDMDISVGRDRIYISLSGLEDSFDEGVQILEDFVHNVQPDSMAWQNVVADIMKYREDAKLDKETILHSALWSYAKYGTESPFTHRVSNDDLMGAGAEKVTQLFSQALTKKHLIRYYGQAEIATVKQTLDKYHAFNQDIAAFGQPKEFSELDTESNLVYFVDYDMVQAEIKFLNKSETFTPELLPYGGLFNQYFGRGLSSIVFQEIRESKALAYSAHCGFSTPSDVKESFYVYGYIGTQADKLGQAIDALMTLMNDMPESPQQFEDSKMSALKKIETDRITKTGIFAYYERMQRRGIENDIREDIYNNISTMSLADLKAFFDKHIAHQSYSYLVIGNKELVDMTALESLGKVQELSLEEVFGY